MEIQYRTSPSNLDYLTPMGQEGRQLIQIYQDKMIWSRPVKVKRKAKPKEQIEEKIYYNEQFVSGACSYYKEIHTLYSDWRDQRKECGKFKPYTERNEKVTFNKISKFPKQVAIEMLEKAIAWSWGRLIELESYEIEKIMWPLREQKAKEERKLEWFTNETEKQQAEQKKQQIENYIKNHPELKQEAKDHVLEKFPTLEPKLQDKMVETRMRLLANQRIEWKI